MKVCKNCGIEFNPCHPTSEFCSKSCATSWRNKIKVLDGTHNFNKLDRSEIARNRFKNGTHPFIKGNMSSESLELKRNKIREARLNESSKGIHPWQNPKNWILNEHNRSINIAIKRKIDVAYLYISECEFQGYFKIGWTYNINIRNLDSRTHKIINATEIKSGDVRYIIDLEMKVKLKFFDLDRSKLLNSTEIFPNEIKDEIINYIKED